MKQAIIIIMLAVSVWGQNQTYRDSLENIELIHNSYFETIGHLRSLEGYLYSLILENRSDEPVVCDWCGRPMYPKNRDKTIIGYWLSGKPIYQGTGVETYIHQTDGSDKETYKEWK